MKYKFQIYMYNTNRMEEFERFQYLLEKNNNLEIQLLPTIGGSNSTVCSAPPPSWITNHAPEQQDTSSRHSTSSP